MNKFVVGLCTIVELGCITGLAAIAWKRNNDCYDAQCELIDEQMEHIKTKIECVEKDYEIRVLKDKLKSSQQGES